MHLQFKPKSCVFFKRWINGGVLCKTHEYFQICLSPFIIFIPSLSVRSNVASWNPARCRNIFPVFKISDYQFLLNLCLSLPFSNSFGIFAYQARFQKYSLIWFFDDFKTFRLSFSYVPEFRDNFIVLNHQFFHHA